MKHSSLPHTVGKVLGFVVASFLFTTILFLLLTFLSKLPPSWTYFHLMAITLLIAIVGGTLNHLLTR